MTVDELYVALMEIREQGQGHLPVVNDDDCDLESIGVNDDPELGLAAIVEFSAQGRGHYSDD